MAESQAPAAPGGQRQAEPNHGLRIFLIWIVLALVADLLIWFLWYPHLPPGRMSDVRPASAVRHRGAGPGRRAGDDLRVDLLRLHPGQLAAPGR